MPTLAETYCATEFLMADRPKTKAFVIAHCIRLFEWKLDSDLAGGTAYEFTDGSACECRREREGKETLWLKIPFASWADYLKSPEGGPAQLARFGGKHTGCQGKDVARIVSWLNDS